MLTLLRDCVRNKLIATSEIIGNRIKIKFPDGATQMIAVGKPLPNKKS